MAKVAFELAVDPSVGVLDADRFYVYVDRTADTGEAFYVGKGDIRRVRGVWRNKKHRAVTAKHGVKRLVVAAFDDEIAALDHETAMIMNCQTYVHGSDACRLACNFTLGGEYVGAARRGFKQPPGAAEKISVSLTGRPKSVEHRERIRSARLGTRWSAAARENMRKAHQCPVERLDVMTGEVLERYSSVNDAAASIGAPPSTIARYSLNGWVNRGYRWRRGNMERDG